MSDCKRNCCERDCACPEPFLGAEFNPCSPTTLYLNDNGKTTEIDFSNAITKGQTDTVLIADAIERLLRFKAERHVDTITASELGAILHLADLGDVSTEGVEQGSILVYKKNNDCAEGCVGTSNLWEPWNAIDGQSISAYYGAGYDSEGNPISIAVPDDPSKTYFLGWNGKNQLSYFNLTEASAPPARGGQVYFDEDLGQLVYVKAN